MKLKKILALLTILLLTLTACKSTEEPVDDEKPLKLSERAGTYTAINDITGRDGTIITIGATGSVNIENEDMVDLNPNSTEIEFTVTTPRGGTSYEINFETKKLKGITGTMGNNNFTFTKNN